MKLFLDLSHRRKELCSLSASFVFKLLWMCRPVYRAVNMGGGVEGKSPAPHKHTCFELLCLSCHRSQAPR